MKKIDVPLPEPSGCLHGDITACGKRAEARIGSRLTNGIPSEIIPVQCIQYLTRQTFSVWQHVEII
jgi:hypothetical protein